MKILTQEEVEHLEFKIGGPKGLSTPIMTKIKELKIGDYLFISKEEWPVKSSFAQFVSQTFWESRTIQKYNVRTLKDDSGWVVERVADRIRRN